MKKLNKIDAARFTTLLGVMAENAIPQDRVQHVYHYVMGDERDELNCEAAVAAYLECRAEGDPHEVANRYSAVMGFSFWE
ncbi:MAG: hypothetical protein ACKO0Z_00570, partial [Betaproteobacteria bacterium]